MNLIFLSFEIDTLYGYVRNHPLVGLEYILDILLIYKKYEGRKMTVPVRRHAYVRNSYVTILYREDPLDSSISHKLPEKYQTREEDQKPTLSALSTGTIKNFFIIIFIIYHNYSNQIALWKFYWLIFIHFFMKYYFFLTKWIVWFILFKTVYNVLIYILVYCLFSIWRINNIHSGDYRWLLINRLLSVWD